MVLKDRNKLKRATDKLIKLKDQLYWRKFKQFEKWLIGGVEYGKNHNNSRHLNGWSEILSDKRTIYLSIYFYFYDTTKLPE